MGYHKGQIEELNDWWLSELGSYVLNHERDIIRNRFASLFGFHLLLLGAAAQLPLVDSCLVPNQTLINPFCTDYGLSEGIKGLWETLPILSNSIDVAVAPHTLGISSDPIEVLKEVHRVLIPEGRILIFGFNPHSFWRLKGLLGKHRKLPWSAKFYSARFLKAELMALGFAIVKSDNFFLQPPRKEIKKFERFNFLNKLGWLGLSNMSGLYYIEAQKKVHGVKPLKAEAVAMNKVKIRQSVARPSATYGEK